MRQPQRVSRADLLLLGLLVALLSAFYASYALRIGNFQDDEEQYLQLARYIAHHFPGALWQSGIYPRGTQRLDPIILALPFTLLRAPAAFQLAHIIQCLLFVSTAIPVFLLGRGAGLGSTASMFAAALAVLAPWAVSATSFLAESAAFPAYAWLLYATFVLVRRPSTAHQVLALLALLIAALARTELLALAPILPLAVLWQELGPKPHDSSRWRARARELPRRLWLRYRLLCIVVAAAIVVLAADRLGLLPGRGLEALAGDYGLPHVSSVSSLLERYRDYLARIAVGTGLLALAVALPWVLATLVRPREEDAHALAVVCTLGLAGLLFSLLEAGPDERYVVYAAVPVSLCAAAALRAWARAEQRRSALAILGVVLGAGVVVALISSTTWPEIASPYDFFSYPAAMFYRRAVLIKLSLLHLPLVHPSAEVIVAVAIVLLAAVWAFVVSRRPRLARPMSALLGVGLICVCATQTVYSLRKYSVSAGLANGPNAAARSWVDRAAPAGANVGAVALSLGETIDYQAIWRTTEFWNTSVGLDVYFTTPGALPGPLGSEAVKLEVTPGSGLLHAYGGAGLKTPVAVPSYLLIPVQGTNRVAIAGEHVATSPYLPLELLKVSRPTRLNWSLAGTSDEGFLTSGVDATATIYSGALAGSVPYCATFSLIGPPNFTGSWPYTVSSRSRVLAKGSIRAQQIKPISVPLAAARGSEGTAGLAIAVEGQVALGAGIVGAQLAFFTVAPCHGTSAAG